MIHHHEHPIWAFLRFLALVAAVSLILMRNASTFDETEIKTILEIAIIVGGWETIVKVKERFFPEEDEEDKS